MDTLKKNPFQSIDEAGESEVPTATLQIYDFINSYLHRDPKSETNVNRASAATMCVRRRWYQKNGEPGIPLAPRKNVNFLIGDLGEKTLVYFIRQGLVGDGKLYSEVRFGDEIGSFTFSGKEIKVFSQPTLTWKINDEITVTAHIDGLGKRNLDGKWELIEIKTASDYGFDEFKTEGPGDYIKQAHACMMTEELQALDVKSVRYYYLKKQTGHIFDRLFEFDQEIADRTLEEFVVSNWKEIPARPYGFQVEMSRGKPTGRQVLGFPCSYCNFVSTCHPDAEKAFKSGAFGVQKPVFVKKTN